MIFKKNKEKEQTPKEILDSFAEVKKKVDELEKTVSRLREENREMLQKIGLVRFNPFSGTGGDQSFSLAVLNNHGDGMIITSFYTSDGSSVYGKPIKNCKSQYALSEQEKEAISLAMDGEDIFKKIGSKKKKK